MNIKKLGAKIFREIEKCAFEFNENYTRYSNSIDTNVEYVS